MNKMSEAYTQRREQRMAEAERAFPALRPRGRRRIMVAAAALSFLIAAVVRLAFPSSLAWPYVVAAALVLFGLLLVFLLGRATRLIGELNSKRHMDEWERTLHYRFMRIGFLVATWALVLGFLGLLVVHGQPDAVDRALSMFAALICGAASSPTLAAGWLLPTEATRVE